MLYAKQLVTRQYVLIVPAASVPSSWRACCPECSTPSGWRAGSKQGAYPTTRGWPRWGPRTAEPPRTLPRSDSRSLWQQVAELNSNTRIEDLLYILQEQAPIIELGAPRLGRDAAMQRASDCTDVRTPRLVDASGDSKPCPR